VLTGIGYGYPRAVKYIKPDAYGVGLDMFLESDRTLSLDLSPEGCLEHERLISNPGPLAPKVNLWTVKVSIIQLFEHHAAIRHQCRNNPHICRVRTATSHDN
jgi:hypothetical protein